MEYRVPLPRWEEKTGAMRASIARGWEPPPLLVHYYAGDILSIRDGNNRYGALVAQGVVEYWTIFWFNDAAALAHFTVTYARYLP